MAEVSEGSWVRTTVDVDDDYAKRRVPAGSTGEVVFAFSDGVCLAAVAQRPRSEDDRLDPGDVVEVELRPDQYEVIAGWTE